MTAKEYVLNNFKLYNTKQDLYDSNKEKGLKFNNVEELVNWLLQKEKEKNLIGNDRKIFVFEIQGKFVEMSYKLNWQFKFTSPFWKICNLCIYDEGRKGNSVIICYNTIHI
jgi:hypothetical protein